MPRVLLATCNLLPEGEEGAQKLLAALAERGLDAFFAVWDDPDVDWSAADLVVVRSTWDYTRRVAEFLDWARRVEQTTPMLNGRQVFTWNADKAYLTELDTRVVPTGLLDETELRTGLEQALEAWGSVVIKPRTGAGGVGVVVADSPTDPRLEGLAEGPWIVQPLVETVRTDGEISVFVFGGRAVARVDKAVAGDEIRVHPRYGGSLHPVPLDPSVAEVAEEAVAAGADRVGRLPDYARVDLMRWEGEWALSELELIEPGLYLDVEPDNAQRFADLVRASLPN